MTSKRANQLRKETISRSKNGTKEIRKEMKNTKTIKYTGIKTNDNITFLAMYEGTPLGLYNNNTEAEQRIEEYKNSIQS